MANLCTKVTVRKRPIKNGQLSLYLDFYPAIRHPKTGKPTRREFLGIYIYANPKEKFEQQYNKKMLQSAELIRCRRIEAIINEDFGFIDHSRGKESFLDFFSEQMDKCGNRHNWNAAFRHFNDYTQGQCCFDDLTVDFCQGFLDYLLTVKTPTGGTMMASTANRAYHKRGISRHKKSPRRRQLCGLYTVLCQRGLHRVTVIIIDNSKNQFHV